MSYEVGLVPETAFTVVMGGLRIEHVVLVSRWEGFMKLRTPDGDVLIVREPEKQITSVVNAILGGIAGSNEAMDRVEAVKVTPALLDLAMAKGWGPV